MVGRRAARLNIALLGAASAIALGLTLTLTPARAGNECLLDSNNNGVADPADADGGAAATTATSLACGPTATAAGGGTTAVGSTATAFGTGSTAVGNRAGTIPGAVNVRNTALGSFAGTSVNGTDNTATGNNAGTDVI